MLPRACRNSSSSGCFSKRQRAQHAWRAAAAPRALPAATPPPLPPQRQRPLGHNHRTAGVAAAAARPPGGSDGLPPPLPPAPAVSPSAEGPSTDLSVVVSRLIELASPYFRENPAARWRLAGVVGLTVAGTGVSVLFNFLGRDFFNALSERDVDAFQRQLVAYLGGFAAGIPILVLAGYYQSRLALEWRAWLTRRLLKEYFGSRAFYRLQAAGGGGGAMVDNPDQRIASDARTFTDAALALFLTLLESALDLLSFSAVMLTIYPPLFAALVAYAAGGTLASLALGKNLVTLNFSQEAREADLRYGLARLRDNAESVAFYGGERAEMRALLARLRAAVANYGSLLVASRNLDFFTSFYRFLIQLLPAAVVAPLYFQGKIEFGVVTQSSSAFSHVLSDVSLVVYQIEGLAGFAAVVDRLGQFSEAARAAGAAGAAAGEEQEEKGGAVSTAAAGAGERPLLELRGLTVAPPSSSGSSGGGGQAAAAPLVAGLDLALKPGGALLVAGPSGAGKTSLLRVLAGLWLPAGGQVVAHGVRGLAGSSSSSSNGADGGGNGSSSGGSSGGSGGGSSGGRAFFLPQKPYMVLGSLRDQLLYPTWVSGGGGGEEGDGEEDEVVVEVEEGAGANNDSSSSTSSSSGSSSRGGERPSDAELEAVLRRVGLGGLLARCAAAQAALRGGAAGGEGSDGASSTNGSSSSAITNSSNSSTSSTSSGALDCVADFGALLSLGEQQRLAFARLLLAAPALALLDEATSALDAAAEAELYAATRATGAAIVSVGHRPGLARFHDDVLLLAGRDGGAWRALRAADYAREEAAAAAARGSTAGVADAGADAAKA